MLFSGIPFLYYFLPAVLIVYYLTPASWRNSVLFLASLIFYGWGGGGYLLLMLILIGAGYIFSQLIQSCKERKKEGWAKGILILALGTDLGVLGYYKYADFFLDNLNRLTGLSLPLLKLSLPIGISFYTFQLMSYTIDVWKGEIRAGKNPLFLAVYVAMFPQLIAGPIVRYSDIELQLKKRELSVFQLASGIRRFIFGLAKKVLLANVLGEICTGFKAAEEKDVLFFWLYAVSFMLQIYFDFSGYSDMAIGLGKLLGFSFPENFRHPYGAKSITKFWRRWHISLGSWFRDYVYIPLGGNRVNKIRWIRNLLIVWFLTGFWHGAAWNFILWGLYFAAFLAAEKLWRKKEKRRRGLGAHLYVLVTVMVSFLIFDASSLAEAGINIRGLVGLEGAGLFSVQSIYYLRSYFITLGIAAVGAAELPARLIEKIKENTGGKGLIGVLEAPVLIGLFLLATAYLAEGSFNPFLYFRF